MRGAKPQDWSNTLWAAAKLGCAEQGQRLLELLRQRDAAAMRGAKPQDWSNTLWAAATLTGRQQEGSAGREELQRCGLAKPPSDRPPYTGLPATGP
jgi:hypothetical protein